MYAVQRYPEEFWEEEIQNIEKELQNLKEDAVAGYRDFLQCKLKVAKSYLSDLRKEKEPNPAQNQYPPVFFEHCSTNLHSEDDENLWGV